MRFAPPSYGAPSPTLMDGGGVWPRPRNGEHSLCDGRRPRSRWTPKTKPRGEEEGATALFHPRRLACLLYVQYMILGVEASTILEWGNESSVWAKSHCFTLDHSLYFLRSGYMLYSMCIPMTVHKQTL